jgi:hypothetical protein
MKTVRSIVGRHPDQDTASPHRLTAYDPYCGDEALLWPGDYDDYLRHSARVGSPPLLDSAEYTALDLEFERVYRDILDGSAPWSAIEPLTEPLLIAGAIKHDGRPPGRVMCMVDDVTLADISENQLPQVGLVGPDRILGPWSDESLPAWVRVQMGAIMAFVPEVDPGVPPWARAIKRKPRPETTIRQSLRVMARTPPMLWAVQGDTLSPMLPLGKHFIPVGPVQGVPPVPAVIGRVVASEQGYFLAASLPLMRRPPADLITRRIRLEWLRLRRRERRLSIEDTLRERSEVLYRSCLEWLWLQLEGSSGSAW